MTVPMPHKGYTLHALLRPKATGCPGFHDFPGFLALSLQPLHDSADASQGLYTACVALGMKQLLFLLCVFSTHEGVHQFSLFFLADFRELRPPFVLLLCRWCL